MSKEHQFLFWGVALFQSLDSVSMNPQHFMTLFKTMPRPETGGERLLAQRELCRRKGGALDEPGEG